MVTCSAKWTAASVAPQRGHGSPSRRWTWSGIGILSGTTSPITSPDEVRAFVKERIGAVKAPKIVLAWDDLPRSKVGKVLKTDIKARLASQ